MVYLTAEFNFGGLFVLLAFGSFLVYSAIHRFRVKRKVSDLPRSRSHTAPQGLVELQGFAWPQNETFPTLTKDNAIYYFMMIEKRVRENIGKHSRYKWVTIFTHLKNPPFYLLDGGGLVLVNPVDAQLDFGKKKTRNWHSIPQEQKDSILKIIEGTSLSGFPPKGFLSKLFSPPFRIVESELLVGSPLYINGDFKTPTQGKERTMISGLTHFYDKIFNVDSKKTRNLTRLLDKNNDGQVNDIEAIQGYTGFAKRTLMMTKGDLSKEREFEIHGEFKRSLTHKLFIANTHEDQLIKRLSRYFYFQFVGGLALITVALVILLNPLFHSFKNQIVQTASTERIIDKNETSQLHQLCVEQNTSACLRLINGATKFKIGKKHLNFYRSQACHLKIKKYCD